MKKIFQTLTPVALALSAVFVAGCAAVPSSADLDKLTADIIKASFRDQALVKTDRLIQDDTNRECSAADVAGKPIDEAKGKTIEAANMKAIKWPSDGKFIGDWREGEKIAQSGRGLTLSRACFARHAASRMKPWRMAAAG